MRLSRPSGKTAAVAVVAALAFVYFGVIAIGLHVKDLGGLSRLPTFPTAAGLLRKPDWTPSSLISLPSGAKGDSIRRGQRLFNETPLYAGDRAKARIACAGCHAEGGIQPYASAVVGVPATFPQFNARAGHTITLEDRIQECFVRSENGQPLDYKGPEMQAIVDYIGWLSTPEPGHKPFVGRGLVNIPERTPDPARGRKIYAAQCAGCHGDNGEGRLHTFPPLWGPDSFNDGAGMHGVRKMAAFVQHNMPQNRMGMLSAQQAWDVSEFVHQQPRPAFNPAYKNF